MLSSRVSGFRGSSVAAPVRCSAQPIRARVVRVQAFGPSGAPATKPGAEKQEKEKGFINDMRRVAMKMHTKDQAPKEGEQKAAPAPKVWAPTRPGYLRFLVESKVVYETFQKAAQSKAHPEYAAFASTGLERSAGLAADIVWMSSKYGIPAPVPKPDGPGALYSKKIAELAESDPQAFICHYYNFFFAHTAGGKMIGNKVAEMLLDGEQINFYKYEGEVQELLDGVRRNINSLAETWTPEQQAHCLEETTESFKMAGQIMQCITAEE
ncbi:hypothetical protein FOA52_004659 [Chlamydomonas sp. UWO 241]|nr:hypothetical protein FOA52_004659 [Chlamydomonas sp. UWO 241]